MKIGKCLFHILTNEQYQCISSLEKKDVLSLNANCVNPDQLPLLFSGLGFDTCWISRLHFEMVITLVLISGIWRSAHFPVKWTPLFPENNFFSVGYCLLFVSTCNQVASTYCTKFNPFLHTSAFKLLSLGDWAVVHIEQNFKALHFSQILNSFLFGLDFSLGDIKD